MIRKIFRKRYRIHAKAKKTDNNWLKTRFQELRKEIKTEIKKQLLITWLVTLRQTSYTNSQRKYNQGIPPLKKRQDSGLAESESDQGEEFNGQMYSPRASLVRFLYLVGQPRK